MGTASHRLGATGENNSLGVKFADFLFADDPGANLGEYANLAYLTGNQLGVLGPKIDNKNFFRM